MGEDLDNAVTAAVRCAVLRRDLDALLESLEASEEFSGVIVLELVEAGCERADIKVGLNGDLLENTLSGSDVDRNAEDLALLCSSDTSKE